MSNKVLGVILVILLALGGGYALSQNSNKKESIPNQTSEATTKPSGETLDLSGQQLTTLPASALESTNITTLNLSNNQLTTLPPEISKLTNLKVLNVENNRLTSLPSSIGDLGNLEIADFGNNRLERLPPELGNLSQLKQLNLSGYNSAASDFIQIKSQLTSTEIKI